MARRSDYQVFVSARMRALAPHGLEESRRAMKQVAAEWRELNRSTNPPDDLDNPMPRRRYRRRRNPSSNSLLKYLLIGGAVYFFVLRRQGAA